MNEPRNRQIVHDYMNKGVSKSGLALKWKLSRERIGQIIKKETGTRRPDHNITQEAMTVVNDIRLTNKIPLYAISKELGCSTETVKSRLYRADFIKSDRLKISVLEAMTAILKRRSVESEELLEVLDILTKVMYS